MYRKFKGIIKNVNKLDIKGGKDIKGVIENRRKEKKILIKDQPLTKHLPVRKETINSQTNEENEFNDLDFDYMSNLYQKLGDGGNKDEVN